MTTKKVVRVKRKDVAEQVLREMAQHGQVTPERVVLEAKKPQSPLHHFFEWDDRKAGYAYRLQQARDLIRSVEVTVTVEERPVEVCYFVRDPQKPALEQGYVTLDDLRRDPRQARAHIEAELAALLVTLKRVEAYAEVLQVKEQVNVVRRSVEVLSRQIQLSA